MKETIEIEDKKGNVFKFEKPNFDCELKFIADGEWIYGTIDDGKLNFNHTFMCAWNINCGTAICVAGDHDFSIYSLTPFVENETNDDYIGEMFFKNEDNDIIGVIYCTKYITNYFLVKRGDNNPDKHPQIFAKLFQRIKPNTDKWIKCDIENEKLNINEKRVVDYVKNLNK